MPKRALTKRSKHPSAFIAAALILIFQANAYANPGTDGSYDDATLSMPRV
ncbi:MAG: hypothetical protein ACOZB0_05965 [Pseudomonadota bacterium]